MEAFTKHPSEAQEIAQQIASSRSKYSGTPPEDWNWFYDVSWSVQLLAEGNSSSHEEFVEFIIQNVVHISLNATTKSKIFRRSCPLSVECARPFVERYVSENFQHLVDFSSIRGFKNNLL
jgi:hypothetical protein